MNVLGKSLHDADRGARKVTRTAGWPVVGPIKHADAEYCEASIEPSEVEKTTDTKRGRIERFLRRHNIGEPTQKRGEVAIMRTSGRVARALVSICWRPEGVSATQGASVLVCCQSGLLVKQLDWTFSRCMRGK